MQFIDLFCGGGLVTHAMKEHGHNPVMSVELDSKAADVFKINNPGCSMFRGDIRSQECLDQLKRYSGVDLVWASPPCTMFSNARGSAPIDESVRDLSVFAMRVIAEIKPRFFVIENSTRIKNHRQFSDIGNVAVSNGYDVRHVDVCSSGLGSPAFRNRTFIYGARDVTAPEIETVSRSAKCHDDSWIDRKAKFTSSVFDRNEVVKDRYVFARMRGSTPYMTYQYFSHSEFRSTDVPMYALRRRNGSTIVVDADGNSRPMTINEMKQVMGVASMKLEATDTASAAIIGNGVDARAVKYIVSKF